MFEQTFDNIDDILYKDAGADGELDYIEQTSWVIFLKYLDDLEKEKADIAELEGKTYQYILEEEYRWSNWAVVRNGNGKIDMNKSISGQDLTEFVDNKLFPYLRKFKVKHEDDVNTIEYKIGQIFVELKNKVRSGYNLREILNLADELQFKAAKDKHELSHLYESKIKNMGNAGRNGGQYYTPRPLIRAIIEVIKPTVGETIYDPACGSAGFLCEAYEYLIRHREKLTTDDLTTIKDKTFIGKEKKELAFIIGTMNMILHGIESPNIKKTNTLSENLRDVQDSDRYDIIIANPPFGGKERKEVQENFDIKSSETAYLFLQHFIKRLKTGGRAGIVIKNTFLSNTDNASISLRRHLLESCNLHSILDMPQGSFLGAGVKTVVLFFGKGEQTEKIWYYQFEAGRSLGKTNPLNDTDMIDFIQKQKTYEISDNSWSVEVKDINKETYDLSVKNPVKKEEAALRSPQDILEEMKALDEESAEILETIKSLI